MEDPLPSDSELNDMNNEKQNFNKITHFITDSYNNLPDQGVIIVKSVRNGFMVNNISVKQHYDGWSVQQKDVELSTFRQRRVAIIFAASSNFGIKGFPIFFNLAFNPKGSLFPNR